MTDLERAIRKFEDHCRLPKPSFTVRVLDYEWPNRDGAMARFDRSRNWPFTELAFAGVFALAMTISLTRELIGVCRGRLR